MSIENDREYLINLHIAEYNMLTSRCTYFMNFQLLILTATLGTIGIVWNNNSHWLLSWWFYLTLQVYGIISAVMFKENYAVLYYLEKELKTSLHKLKIPKQFWKYEEKLQELRLQQKVAAQDFLEWLIVVIMAVFFLCVTIFHNNFSHYQLLESFLGFMLGLGSLVFYYRQMKEAIRLRKASVTLSLVKTKKEN